MHPLDFTICYDQGTGCQNVRQWNSGSALGGQVGQGYVLAPTMLGGGREWMAHLTELLLAWVAVIAMASLVLRLGWNRQHAMVGALLLVAVAPFLPMASTAMPDMLGAALVLVAHGKAGCMEGRA